MVVVPTELGSCAPVIEEVGLRLKFPVLCPVVVRALRSVLVV